MTFSSARSHSQSVDLSFSLPLIFSLIRIHSSLSCVPLLFRSRCHLLDLYIEHKRIYVVFYEISMLNDLCTILCCAVSLTHSLSLSLLLQCYGWYSGASAAAAATLCE